jgi:hypothetical protein
VREWESDDHIVLMTNFMHKRNIPNLSTSLQVPLDNPFQEDPIYMVLLGIKVLAQEHCFTVAANWNWPYTWHASVSSMMMADLNDVPSQTANKSSQAHFHSRISVGIFAIWGNGMIQVDESYTLHWWLQCILRFGAQP